jgi:hypothetical protein
MLQETGIYNSRNLALLKHPPVAFQFFFPTLFLEKKENEL